MSNSQALMEDMLFDYATTYKTDFKAYALKAPIRTTYKPKKTSARASFRPLRDIHTVSDWKTTSIPFDLLIQRKPILRTNPMEVQKKCEKPIDLGREEAQRTRPRRVMTPAVSMDDIDNPRARALLCEDMYTSEMAMRLREAVTPSVNVQAPLPGIPAPANPVVLQKLQLPVVPEEWRMQTLTWDGDQLRGYSDPTKEFWLKRPLETCRSCEETKAVVAHRRMQRQMKQAR